MKKSFAQRQIPTLLGLAILVASLIGGVAFLGQSSGAMFRPRAAPQTTPKKVKVTNVKDDSFTVSFITDEATAAFIKYGTTANSLKLQAGDDRDQLSGSVAPYNTHYITVRDLTPDTTYYYVLGTGTNAKFDNNGTPFVIKTAKKSGSPPLAKTIYGNIVTSASTPAGGVMVYVSIEGVGPLSALTKDSGSWAIPLSSARTTDGSQYAQIDQATQLVVNVQGNGESDTSSATFTVADAQPAKTITLGQNLEGGAPSTTTTPDETVTEQPTTSASPDTSLTSFTQSPSPMVQATPFASSSTETNTSSQTGLGGTTTPVSSASGEVVNVSTTGTETQVVNTTQPTIVGTAVPNTVVSIEIHSSHEVVTQTTTDSSGQYTIDLEALKETLEPGPHTITISYVNPTTGQTVTETKSFIVEDLGMLAAASTSPQPFGTSNPFPVVSPSPSPTVTATASAEPRVSVPATSSSLPKSGSTSTTYFLILSGAFFLIAGIWSYFQTRTYTSHTEQE